MKELEKEKEKKQKKTKENKSTEQNSRKGHNKQLPVSVGDITWTTWISLPSRFTLKPYLQGKEGQQICCKMTY